MGCKGICTLTPNPACKSVKIPMAQLYEGMKLYTEEKSEFWSAKNYYDIQKNQITVTANF